MVLGGTRFIGRQLVHQLSALKHDITILNRGKTQAVLPPGVKRLYADRRDPESLRQVLSGQEFDAIFDFTGYEPRNLEPIVELFAGKIQHYVFQSTAEVYARTVYLPIQEDFPTVSGETLAKGLAAYGAGKVQCEDLLLRQYRAAKFPVTILRCPVIYGPGNWMHDREFSYFVRLLQGKPALIPGNGSSLLHFTHVEDIARAHLSVVGQETTLGQVFNIASAEAVTIEGYIDTIAEITGQKANKVFLDFKLMAGLERLVFPFIWEHNLLLATTKAKEYFGFEPAFNIAEGLRQTYQWWTKNLGVANTRLEPGRLGFDVDLAYEEEIARRQ